MNSASKKILDRVIAIDPGYDRAGIAVMDRDMLLHSECFIPPKGVLEARLRGVYHRINTLIQKYRPNALALETLYFSKNQKTAIAVAEARGIIMLAAAEADILLFEYSPQEVKIAVTGSGNAAKEGVVKMVERLIALPVKKRLDDEYDAIALALAHQAQTRLFHRQGK